MIERAGDQLREAANTNAPQTLAMAARDFEQARAGFAAAAEGSDDPDAARTLKALATAHTLTDEAIRNVLGGIAAVRQYAQSTGIDLGGVAPAVPTESAPVACSDFSAVKWPSESDVIEEVPNAHIAPAVRQRARAIQIAIDRGVEPWRLNGYIGGNERHVFRLPDGHILKLPYASDNSTYSVFGEALAAQRGYVTAMKRAEGEEGFEQFAGWADEINGLVICQEVEGKRLQDLGPDGLRAIPQEHYDKLMTTLQRASALRIGIDNVPANFMYDPRRGFVLIDCHDEQDVEKNLAHRADFMAWSVGSTVCLFSQEVIDHKDTTTLAIVSKRFYTAIANAFGLQTAGNLLRKWHEENLYVPTNSW